jgi:hypothetical protein
VPTTMSVAKHRPDACVVLTALTGRSLAQTIA